MQVKITLLAGAFTLAAGAALAGGPAPDANLYTTYQVSPDHTSLSWITCGATAQSSGCYGSGSIGPFERLCAVLQGAPVVNGSKVVRRIYALDAGTAAGAAPVLYEYVRTETVSPSYDAASVVLKRHAALPLTGGPGVPCFMAANAVAVYAGTATSYTGALVDRQSFAVGSLPGFSPPELMTAITADSRGYVAAQWSGGFYLFGPDGSLQGDGGGGALLLDSNNALPVGP